MTSKNVLKYIVIVLVAGNLALLSYVLLGAFDRKPEPMPNPNGYDDFVKAAPLLRGNPVAYQKMTLAELEDLAGANTEAMSLLESGISKQCRVVTDYSSSSNFSFVVLPRLASLKQAALLFCAEGRLAELEGRTNDAAQLYLDGIRFGQDVGQGGVFIEKLVGVACEASAEKPLEKVFMSLNSKHCARIAQALETMNAQEETDEQVLHHENEFSRKFGGIRGQLARLVMFKNIHESEKKVFIKIHTSQLHRRQLMIAFASRAYELERGKPPPNTAALVPDYLKQIPKDPITGTKIGR